VARLEIYRANLDIIHDRPVFGLGFGRYRKAATPYYEAHPLADRRSHAHSNVLQIAAEGGLVALAAFMSIFVVALRRGWGRLSGRRGDDWAVVAGAWLGIVGFLVAGLAQYNFGDNEPAIGMWAALAVLTSGREERAG